ncbi:MAG: hypothetical protein ACLTLH_09005, partial [Ruminococcus sp.]|uniref:hypothetical protein n=1 Tax=Ruminococcus sp. TaxID=41978 RepID=UPI00399462D5
LYPGRRGAASKISGWRSRYDENLCEIKPFSEHRFLRLCSFLRIFFPSDFFEKKWLHFSSDYGIIG